MAQKIDTDESHVRVAEGGLRPGGEIGQARSSRDHQIRLLDDAPRGRRTGHSVRSQQCRRGIADGPLSGEGFDYRDAQAFRKSLQFVPGFRIMNAAAGNDGRASGSFQQRGSFSNAAEVGWAALYMPNALVEEMRRVVAGVHLYVLRQGERNRAR